MMPGCKPSKAVTCFDVCQQSKEQKEDQRHLSHGSRPAACVGTCQRFELAEIQGLEIDWCGEALPALGGAQARQPLLNALAAVIST